VPLFHDPAVPNVSPFLTDVVVAYISESGLQTLCRDQAPQLPLRTLGQAVYELRKLQYINDDPQLDLRDPLGTRLNPWLAARYGAAPSSHLWACVGSRPHHWIQAFEDLLSGFPSAWRHAAEATVLGPSALPVMQVASVASVAAVERDLLQRLGWRLGPRTIRLQEYTVRDGTALIFQRQRELAAATPQLGQPRPALSLLAAFHDLADPHAGVRPAEAAAVVQTVLRRLWAVRWDNRRKEVFWLLVLDGHPTPARMHSPGCTCGGCRPAWQRICLLVLPWSWWGSGGGHLRCPCGCERSPA
jgi:hypothetical protein